MAAMKRTSTSTSSVPPTRRNRRSCSTRSSFTCMPRLVSPTSSRNSVPRWAASNRPFLVSTAPVNGALHVAEQLPLEQRLGKAPQLTATNGWSLALRLAVDLARRPLLAGARLAGDEHGGVGRAATRDHQADHVEDAAAAPGRDELLGSCGPRRRDALVAEALHLEVAARTRCLSVVDVERLGQVVDRARGAWPPRRSRPRRRR